LMLFSIKGRRDLLEVVQFMIQEMRKLEKF